MNILILKTTTCTCIFENNIDEEKKHCRDVILSLFRAICLLILSLKIRELRLID